MNIQPSEFVSLVRRATASRRHSMRSSRGRGIERQGRLRNRIDECPRSSHERHPRGREAGAALFRATVSFSVRPQRQPQTFLRARAKPTLSSRDCWRATERENCVKQVPPIPLFPKAARKSVWKRQAGPHCYWIGSRSDRGVEIFLVISSSFIELVP
jgi:hypothetical protein